MAVTATTATVTANKFQSLFTVSQHRLTPH